MRKVERVSRKNVFDGRVIQVTVDTVKLPNDHVIDLEMAWHPGAAAIVPLDDAGNVCMVRQARYAADGWLLEVPAGKLDKGEDPASCARRELTEETGLVARELLPLGFIFVSPGFTNERIHLFLARGLTQAEQALEADEVLSLEKLPLARAVEMALSGELEDAKSVVSLLRAHALVGGTR